MRRGVLIATAVLLTVAAVLGVLAFFNARDDSTIGEDTEAPGQVSDALTGDTLKRGNVVLRYGDPAQREALEALARDVAGGDDPALVEAGQGVVVERGTGGQVVASAYKRTLTVSSPEDPKLREFVQYWLGRSSVP